MSLSQIELLTPIGTRKQGRSTRWHARTHMPYWISLLLKATQWNGN